MTPTQKTYRALLVDDEYMALELLENFLQRMPGWEVAGRYTNPLHALEALRETPADLLFLDIQMPALSGLSLLKGLAQPPVVVFTTAYREYAADAFDLHAVDYLVKPFSFERFLQALEKARHELERRRGAIPSPQASSHLTLKVDGKLMRIPLSDILYVEGLREYVRIHCPGERLITFERMKQMETLLPQTEFLRIHKSYIVAKKKVKALEGNMLLLTDGQKIPLSRRRREEIIRALFE